LGIGGFPVSRDPEKVIGSPEAFRKSQLVPYLWPDRVKASRNCCGYYRLKKKSGEALASPLVGCPGLPF
jgi:hypothetical protein